MASLGGDQQILTNSQTAEPIQRDSREGSAERKVAKDRDEKLKLARERQNEERQRKIEELRAQAEAAQRYQEQKQEERRRRIEEIRNRDSEKRHQVEERKRAIMEAEKERREYILRKNQVERESRLETKKRDRNSIVFAFGSSTPRLLDPADYGTVSPSQFWSQRRSTSISNVAGATLSRRSSERELADSGAKKRATSASGTERHDEDNVDTSHIVFRSVARRKTDLMPTIPSPRDGHYGSRSSLSNTPRTPGRAFSMTRLDQLARPIRRNGEHIRAILERERREHMEMLDETESLGGGRRSNGRKNKSNNSGNTSTMSRSMTHLAGNTRPKYSLGGGISSSFRPLGSNSNSNREGVKSSRSGNVTPGGSMNTSRPGSAMSTSTNMSTSGFVNRRSVPAARKPRPASIAGTGVSLDEINKLKKENKPPMKTSTPSTSAQTTPKRTTNLMSTSMIVTPTSSRLSSAEKRTPSKRDSPLASKSTTPRSLSKTSSSDRLNKISKDKPKDMPALMSKSAYVTPTTLNTTTSFIDNVEKTNTVTPVKSKDEKNALNAEKTEEINVEQTNSEQVVPVIETSTVAANEEKVDKGNEKNLEKIESDTESTNSKKSRNGSKENSEIRELTPPTQTDNNDLMTASMMARKITTEEEAKAALAERRRLAREEAERQAELERQRLEAERLAEIKRQEEEAELQRKFEEEAMRLAEEQRRGEEERLRQAIEEAKKREEEERRKREEEEKQRLEREEAEKKAKEEAEKQKVEVAERLKREEKEREERRKRVEAIMSRTRKGAPTPNSTPVKTQDNNDTTKTNTNEQENQQSQQPTDTNSSGDSNSTSGSATTATTPIPAVVPSTTPVSNTNEVPNSQAMYEQAVIDKEHALINSFSNMIIDENAKNLQQQQLQQQPQIQILEVTNGKLHADFPNNDIILQNNTTTSTTTTNGNGHIENINNKNDINILQDVVAPINQLIDLSIESQDLNNAINFNNNNSLLTTNTAALVTADSHDNQDISLL